MTQLSDRNIIIALVMLQIAVCLPFINSFPIALDEPFSIFWAQQDLGEMVSLFANENNPPLHFVVLHYWIKLFGIESISVRSLSLIFNILTIPVVFAFARKLLTPSYASLVVLIFICSSFNHYHAMESRVYSLFVLLSTLAFYDLYRFIFEKKSPYIRLAIWNILLLYSHYLGSFVIVVEVIVLVLFIEEFTIRRILLFIFSLIITVLGYLPGINWFFQRLGNFSEKGTWVPEPHYSELYGNIIRFYNKPFSFITIITIVLFLFFIFRKKLPSNNFGSLRSKKNLYIFLIFLIPYFGMFIFSKLIQPVFLDRYLLFTSIPLYFTLALVVDCVLPKNKSHFSLLIILPLAATAQWFPDNNREPDLQANYVREIEEEHSLKVICPPFYDLTFLYHYSPDVFTDYRNLETNLTNSSIQKVYNYSDIEMRDSSSRIIFIDGNSKFIYPDNTVKSGLDKNFTLREFREFKGGEVVYCYDPK